MYFYWAMSIFGVHTAAGLLKAVFWYNSKCFRQLSGDKLRELERKQYIIGYGELSGQVFTLYAWVARQKTYRIVSNNVQSNIKT